MTKKQAQIYLSWYLANADRRVQLLCEFIGNAEPTSGPQFLAALEAAAEGLRAVSALQLRPLADIEAQRATVRPELAQYVSEYEHTDDTVAYCYDMEILMAKYLLTEVPGSRLEVFLRGKSFYDYGFVVVVNKDYAPVNCYSICMTLAVVARDGRDVVAELHEVLANNIRLLQGIPLVLRTKTRPRDV